MFGATVVLVAYRDSTEANRSPCGTYKGLMGPVKDLRNQQGLKPQRLIFYTISETAKTDILHTQYRVGTKKPYLFSHFRGKNICLF